MCKKYVLLTLSCVKIFGCWPFDCWSRFNENDDRKGSVDDSIDDIISEISKKTPIQLEACAFPCIFLDKTCKRAYLTTFGDSGYVVKKSTKKNNYFLIHVTEHSGRLIPKKLEKTLTQEEYDSIGTELQPVFGNVIFKTMEDYPNTNFLWMISNNTDFGDIIIRDGDKFKSIWARKIGDKKFVRLPKGVGSNQTVTKDTLIQVRDTQKFKGLIKNKNVFNFVRFEDAIRVTQELPGL